MKKFIFLIVSISVSTNAFAMASKPKISPTAQCYAQVDKSCIGLYGDPMNPNFPYSVKSQSNVTGVEYLKNPDGSYQYKMPSYDPNKKTYDPVGFYKCVQPGYEACRASA